MPVIETALTRLLQIKHPIFARPHGLGIGRQARGRRNARRRFGDYRSGYADSAAIKKELSAASAMRASVLASSPGRSTRGRGRSIRPWQHSRPCSCFFSFGSPQPFADAIKRAGCLLMCQVQTLAQAKEAVVSGADIIIAQGRDAGGHAGMTRGTMGLVPAIVDTTWPDPRCRRWRNFGRARTLQPSWLWAPLGY